MTNTIDERFSLDITPRLKVLLNLVGRIFENSFLKRQLSLIGGSAIHLVHSSTPQSTRLTLDADFNFRDVGTVPRHQLLAHSIPGSQTVTSRP